MSEAIYLKVLDTLKYEKLTPNQVASLCSIIKTFKNPHVVKSAKDLYKKYLGMMITRQRQCAVDYCFADFITVEQEVEQKIALDFPAIPIE